MFSKKPLIDKFQQIQNLRPNKVQVRNKELHKKQSKHVKLIRVKI